MNHLAIAIELKRNQKVFKHLFHGLLQEQYTWQPQPGKWCLLEVICHLYDEEREDFRARTKQVLQDPALPLAPIDPQGWVTDRKYMEQDYDQMLQRFLEERDESVAWLESLQYAAWDNACQHPKLGLMPARRFLENWLAHDYHHIRQINNIKYLYLDGEASASLDYAGNW